jgi:hypothetical protein
MVIASARWESNMDNTPPLTSPESNPQKHQPPWAWWVVGIAVHLTVALIAFIINLGTRGNEPTESFGDDPSTPQPGSSSLNETPTESTSSEITAEETTTATVEDAVGDGGDEPSSTSVQFLNQLDSDHGTVLNVDTGGFEINDVLYPNSTRVAVDAGSESQHAIEYDIDGDWETLKIWVGLDDTSEQNSDLYFQVYLDDQPIEPGYTLGQWESAEAVSIPVAGKHRIKLTVIWISGGVANDSEISDAVWGDAQLNR